MKDFDIAKYLREHQLGSYGILNHYVDLKPLKEAGEQLSLGFSGKKFKEGDKVKLDPKYKDDVDSALKMAGGEVSLADIDNFIDMHSEETFTVSQSDERTTTLEYDDLGYTLPTALLIQAETVSEANSSMENMMYELVNRQHLQQLQKIAQMILKDLTNHGFEAEDVEKFLNLQIKAATVPYAQNPKVTAEVEEMEEEWDPSRDQISKKFIGRLPKSVQAKSSVDKVLAALKTAGISTQDLIAFVDAVKTDPDALAFE